MKMWFMIMIVSLLLMAAALAYLSSRVWKFAFIDRFSKGIPRQKRAAGAALVLGSFLLITILMGLPNAFVCALYFSFAWIISDSAFFFLKKKGIFHSEKYYAGLAAVIIAVSSLAAGWYNAHHVWRTEYNLTAEKTVQPLKIAMFADSHVGTTFSGKGLFRHIESIQADNPDMLIIAGDFVDDSTSRKDMEDACRALGSIKTKYGVYFSFGNHDGGYYGAEKRGFSGADLINELKKNGVNVLRDEAAEAGDYYVIGRRDYSMEREQNGRRKAMNELLQGLDNGKYSITIDHQPADYAGEAAAGADLVLSGHTHGGQLFPFNRVGKWIGANDRIYGHERRNKTDFIVTSGISAWSIRFKTGTKSEYVIVNIKTAQ